MSTFFKPLSFISSSLNISTNRFPFRIQKGLVLLVGISTEDTEAEVEKMSSKVLKMRIFEDEAQTNLWKRTVKDANAQILSGKSSPSLFFLSKYLKILTAMLLVSQFTLMARTKKGTKPDLHMAAKGKSQSLTIINQPSLTPQQDHKLSHSMINSCRDLRQIWVRIMLKMVCLVL